MKTRVLIAFSLLLAGGIASAQSHPNLSKGFNANGVYQFNGLDSVNAFNGNLNVRIPLGQTYSVAPGMSYQLGLTWNNNQWMSRVEHPPAHPDTTVAYPSLRSNAGFGWSLSLGRLYPAASIYGTGDWTYESPDGADHQFSRFLHPEDDEQIGTMGPYAMDPYPTFSAVGYTRDGSYLRMTFVDTGNVGTNGPADANDRRRIEFPDGSVHVFKPPPYGEGPWLLDEIVNQFPSNYVRIDYSTPNVWRIHDSRGREHKVFFQNAANYDQGARLLVDRVELASYNGGKAVYDLSYIEAEPWRPYWHDPEHHDTTLPDRAHLWILNGVVGYDDTAPASISNVSYSFAHDITTGGPGRHPGQLYGMTLPTGGSVTWEFIQYPLPVANTIDAYLESTGVWARRTYARGATPGVSAPLSTSRYSMKTRCSPTNATPPCLPRDSVTTIRNYNGSDNFVTPNSPAPISRSEHYFSVTTFDAGEWKAEDYGKPFTRNDQVDGLQLTQRVFAGVSDDPLQSTYVHYSCDQYTTGRCGGNARVDKQRIVYDDDTYVQTAHTNFDGLGHYRTTTATSTIPGTPPRSSTTNFNPPNGTYPGSFTMHPPTVPWVLGLADWATTVENGVILKTELDYSGVPGEYGFLTRKRVIKDTTTGARGATDGIVVYTPDSRGAVASERFWGGDEGSLGLESLPSAALVSPWYEITHSETPAGTNWIERSNYTGDVVLMRDVTIDRNTGLVKESRDTSGVVTTYVYDFLNRMTQERPAGRAWTVAEYVVSGNSEIRIKQFPNGQQSGTALTTSKYELDGFGRVTRERSSMPGGSESYRDIVYDGLGRQVEVSELGSPSAKTISTYDGLGRPLTVTSPASDVTTFSYSGIRERSRTTSLKTPLSSNQATVTNEVFDGYGRLVAVTQPSGPTTAAAPNGANVTTRYGYDTGNRMTSVTMTGAGSDPVQHRFFEYDGRGLLRWESQPESGLTSYAYDQKGNVLTKRQAGDPKYDLFYSYDSAERLTRIDTPNPNYPESELNETRPVKYYQYAMENLPAKDGAPIDYSTGKLRFSARYNYTPLWSGVIWHSYGYRDLAGRRTARSTFVMNLYDQILKTVTMWNHYNDLDLLVSTEYPMCTSCGYSENVDRAEEERTYDQGRLTSLTNFAADITYWPNGMRNVLPHANGIADTQTVGAMARPTALAFGQYDRCVKPKFTTQPSGATGSTTLSATATGTSTIKYDWYDLGSGSIPLGREDVLGLLVGTGSTLSVNPSVTTEYIVIATNECGRTSSNRVKVTVGTCPTPEIRAIRPVVQPDHSWILTPALVVRTTSLTYQWKRLDTNVVVGTSETLAVGALSQTTAFRLTVTDSCGTTSADVTIAVELSMSTTGLTAVANAPRTQITLSWPAVTNATAYLIERRSGDAWVLLDATTSTTYVDAAVTANHVYAYRVQATSASSNSNYSNTDVASTAALSSVVAGQVSSSGAANTMLQAVNLVRATAGLPAVTWATILSPTEPVVATGNTITARQILACRARVNEALLVLGARAPLYTDADLTLVPLKAVHITQVQGAIE